MIFVPFLVLFLIINFYSMKILKFFSILFLLSVPCLSQTEVRTAAQQQNVYKVAKATGPITIDGKMDEPDWQKAEVRTFDNFYRRDKAPERQNTKFRMLWDDANLYLFYECEDTSLTARETNFDGAPYLDDCAEFFCSPVPDTIHMHFGVEINIVEAKYDYIVLWEYYNGRTIFIRQYNPTYQVKATTDGTINNDRDKDKKWQMELAVPFSAFAEFNRLAPPKTGTRWAFQAVRQDRNFVNDRFRSTSTLFPILDFRKDVHRPSDFGFLEFGD